MRWLASRAPPALLGWANPGSSRLAQQGAKSCPGRGGGHHLVSRQEKSGGTPAGDLGAGGGVRSTSLLQAREARPQLSCCSECQRDTLSCSLTRSWVTCPWHWPIHAPSLNTALALEAPHKVPGSRPGAGLALGVRSERLRGGSPMGQHRKEIPPWKGLSQTGRGSPRLEGIFRVILDGSSFLCLEWLGKSASC